MSARSVQAHLNHVHHQYAIQEDGGLIQESGLNDDEPKEWGLINAQNWVHDALVERSTKWGIRFDRINTEFMKIGLRGTSIMVASGDSGANGRADGLCTSKTLTPGFPASSPYVTAVGATQVQSSSTSTQEDGRGSPASAALAACCVPLGRALCF